ncbi:hypothetical protein A9Q89_02375 [Gammaproteobacteria bacterium 53_120_T64]|nr:hypothetical protein A9Q89_02375 [Gammaproteobacteria bacterium 53_120_T64]
MLLSAEISMYPLAESYIPPIDAFIEKLNSYADLKVETFPTCTVIMAEQGRVMEVLQDAMVWSHENYGKAIFVTKFILDYEAL